MAQPLVRSKGETWKQQPHEQVQGILDMPLCPAHDPELCHSPSLRAETDSCAVFVGEPELRKQLREKRLREMHQRMQSQLAEKQARDAAESSEKDEKVDLRNRVVKPKIDAWQQGKKVCAMLCCFVPCCAVP